MARPTPLSGVPEWLPADRIVEQHVLDVLRATFELHGFAGIETRAVEPLDQLLRKDLASWIGRALRTGGLAPQRLSLELTETTDVHDLTELGRAIRRIADAGHDVFLDDLTIDDIRLRLMALPFAGVKLDKALVARLPHDARARGFVRMVLDRAERSGQVVTAEGVSDARLWRAVAGLGVHRAQGFWVGRPLPVSVLPAWAQSWAASPRG